MDETFKLEITPKTLEDWRILALYYKERSVKLELESAKKDTHILKATRYVVEQKHCPNCKDKVGAYNLCDICLMVRDGHL